MNSSGRAPGSQASLRAANRGRVLEALDRHGPLTQVEIAAATGLSAASVSNLVRDLVADREVETSRAVRNGRRAALVAPVGGRGVVAGVAFGDRDVRLALGTGPRDLRSRVRLPLPPDHVADEGLSRAARLVSDMLDSTGTARTDLRAVALGLPAPVDSVSGHVGSEAILPGWRGVAAARELETALGVPVVLDNTANLAAQGELVCGALVGVRHGCHLKTSHGIGAGIVLDGRVHRGSAGTAGEIGHVTIDENGPVCRCGNRGCLDTFVGSSALSRAVAVTHGHLALRDLVARALAGDPGCRRVVTDAGRHIGVAVAGVVNLLNPERVSIGGTLARTGDLLLDPIREGVERCAIPSAAASVEIVPGSLGEDADVVGAMAVAAERASTTRPA